MPARNYNDFARQNSLTNLKSRLEVGFFNALEYAVENIRRETTGVERCGWSFAWMRWHIGIEEALAESSVGPDQADESELARRIHGVFAGWCRLSAITVECVHKGLEKFREWLGNRGNQDSDYQSTWGITLAWLSERELAPTSLARHIVSLRMFFKYLQLEGEYKKKPSRVIGKPEALGAENSIGNVAE